MENQPLDMKIVLNVNLGCCEACPKKLEKALFELTGVSSHTINTKENLVSLSGTVESATIIKLIYAKLRKKANLVSYEPQSTDDKEEKPKNTKIVEDKDSNNKIKSPHNEEMHKTCCCQDGSCPIMGNNVHKCEVYDPPPEVKDFVCRNYSCKSHPRSREITDKVPEDESSARPYGYMRNRAQVYYGRSNPIRGSYYQRWYPAQFGYYPPPRRPQPPCDYD